MIKAQRNQPTTKVKVPNEEGWKEIHDQEEIEEKLNTIHFTQAALTPPVIDDIHNKLEELINTNSDEILKNGIMELKEDWPLA